VVAIAERVIEANDKPRAEVMVDVQILEVSRERAKAYGLDLGSYSAALAFSPESAPAADSKPFNLNTISQGVSTADFYLAVPSAVVRFLESDSNTKVLAKPNLRGAEGQKLSLNLGEDVPIPSTTFTPLAGTTGPGTSPLTSFGYRTIGIIVEMTPRVTYDGDIILELTLENSARGQDSNIAGQNLPSFFSRKVTTKLRLRDGESNLLAGLLREDERRSLKGFPGVMRLPIVRQLFSANDSNIKQTDIVMLLTPRIVRTHDLRAQDLSPIYIGTQSNMSLTGPPATIGGGVVEPDPAPAAPPAMPIAPGAIAPAAPGATQPGTPTAPSAAPTAPASPATTQPTTQPPAAPVLPTGSTQRPVVPPGSSPIPGMVPAPTTPTTPPSNVTVFSPPPEPPAAAPPTAAPPPAQTSPAPGAAPQPAPAAPARVTLTPPSEMRVGSGPYTIPISIAAATRVSTLTLSITYNPALIRVRNVQEGTFMRQGGAAPAFNSQIDEKSGRIDIVITRPGDKTGASAAGLVAALLVEPVAAGTGALGLSGSASVPGGGAAALQLLPAGITVR
jgi:hypothetical protein